MNSPDGKSAKAVRPSVAGNSAESAGPSAWKDQRIELIIGNLLRAGVLLSASVVVIGGIIYVSRHGSAIVDYRNFRGELSPLRNFAGIIHGMRQLSGRAIIQFGLLLADRHTGGPGYLLRRRIRLGTRLPLRGLYAGGAGGAHLQPLRWRFALIVCGARRLVVMSQPRIRCDQRPLFRKYSSYCAPGCTHAGAGESDAAASIEYGDR